MCQDISLEILPIPHWASKNGHKNTQTSSKVCSSLITIDFRLAGVSFINLVHFSHSTLVFLFTLWKDKCWLKLRRNFFCQNNTVMLTYTHSYSPVTLLWRCSWDSNEKQNCKSFFNYEDYYEAEVYFFFFAMLVSPYDVISCNVINVMNVSEIL